MYINRNNDKTYLSPHLSYEDRAARQALAIPARTPGIPWRLFTPHVSCNFTLEERQGCNKC